MKNYSTLTKERLLHIIEEMDPMTKYFVKNPGKDFTRNRKLGFKTVMRLILSMNGNSLTKELLDYFSYDENTATSSAFIQQRNKITSLAFEHVFHEFTHGYDRIDTWNGYRLLAIDGSDLSTPRNKNHFESYIQYKPSAKGYNLIHLNAIYDLCNKIYLDALLQNKKKENEKVAFYNLVDRSSLNEPVIIIADRNYESYNVFAHAMEKSWNYLIRVKDINSNGILASLDLPDADEFDTTIHLDLTKSRSQVMKSQLENYKFIKNSKFDYFKFYDIDVYPMELRIIRFKISNSTYESIITNLNIDEFPPSIIKELYHKRWGIETSFRELKYAVGLANFHSKTVSSITQEVFAKLIMYNFCEMITMNVIIKQKPTKYGYQANFNIAIQICKYFFSIKSGARPPNVEALIKKNILPIRDGRIAPRKIKIQSAVSFIYRVA